MEYSINPDVVIDVNIDFEEIKKAVKSKSYQFISLDQAPEKNYLSKRVSYRRALSCPECKGALITKSSKTMRCGICRGRGHINTMSDGKPISVDCKEWHKTGLIVQDLCRTCGRNRLIYKTTTLDLKIPLNVKDGDLLKIKGYGNFKPGPSFGSLFINMHVLNQDKNFDF